MQMLYVYLWIQIIELFGQRKGGNFKIHIWAFSAISSAKESKSGYIFIIWQRVNKLVCAYLRKITCNIY